MEEGKRSVLRYYLPVPDAPTRRIYSILSGEADQHASTSAYARRNTTVKVSVHQPSKFNFKWLHKLRQE